MRLFENNVINVLANVFLAICFIIFLLLVRQHFKMYSPDVVATPTFNPKKL